MISRVPFGAAGCVICLSVEPPSSPAGVTSFLPGSAAYPSSYFGLPWNYDLSNVTNATAFGPVSRGVDIHDNVMMRSLPAVSSYTLWGFGRMFSVAGFIDPPVPDSVLKATARIAVSANVNGLAVHNNSIHNVRRGIVLNDNVVAPSQTSISIAFNDIHDAWEYGIAAFGSGTLGTFDLIGNIVDVDPYLISPGRSGGHGAWAQNYGASACFDISYNVIVRMADNTFSDCYAIQTSNTWIMSRNAVRGSVYGGTTGQPNSWSSANYGVGVFPTNVGDQFFIEPITADPTANPPGSYGVGSVAHYRSSSSAPTSGYHVVGDVIWSAAPASCNCSGWIALTTGTGWTASTDYRALVIQ